MQRDESKNDFVRRRLPWLLAGLMALVYCFTLSRWITFTGAATQAVVFGWDWRPNVLAPLYFVLTYPLRWLPAAWQIIGLNAFSALCASAALGLLARSVMILPYDRTRDLREIEQDDNSLLSIRARWVPPLLAVLVCGLQLTLWEHAVSSSFEALDLLIFAYVIWELLEYRLDRREVRLIRLAFVYGLGVANNFAMIGFAPAFMVAIIWIKGWGFFNLRFLVTATVAGLLGLTLYLVQPLVHSLSGLADVNFWGLLRAALGTQKNALLNFPRFILLMIGLTSLFPVFFMGIKWPHHFGDISAVGTALTNIMTHVMHGVFLLACLYVAFDPPFSPRRLAMGYPLLPFYFLGALSVGYFSGYFLLLFSKERASTVWRRNPPAWRKATHAALRAMVWAALVAVPAGLVWQNVPKLRVSSSNILNQFSLFTSSSLPPAGAVVLADDPPRLFAIQASLVQRGQADQYMFVESRALQFQAYHRFLRRKYDRRWPLTGYERPIGYPVEQPALVELMEQISRTNAMYYLHPSFGYYFERFYPQPKNLCYRLEAYPTNAVEAPVPSPEELAENDRFWQQIRGQELAKIIKAVKKTNSKQQIESSAAWMGIMYSRAANHLGVEYQRAGNLAKAAEYFTLALALNPESPLAYINAEFNKRLRAGTTNALVPDEEITRRLQPYQRNWELLLTYNGPVDEPNSCFSLGQSFLAGNNVRQAAQQFLRTLAYDPRNIDARLALGAALVETHFPDRALQILAETRVLLTGKKAQTNDPLSVLQIEAWAYASKNELPTAVKLLTDAQEKNPKHTGPFATLAEIYLSSGRLTNAMLVLAKQIQAQPEDANALANYAALKIRSGQINEAFPLLDKALKLQPRHPYALMNRAIAYLQLGKADEAERDYATLERLLPNPPYAVYFGLGETAKLKKNTKDALKYYQRFLQQAPIGTPEINYIREQIKLIKSGKA